MASNSAEALGCAVPSSPPTHPSRELQSPLAHPLRGQRSAARHRRAATLTPVLGDQEGVTVWEKSTSRPQSLTTPCLAVDGHRAPLCLYFLVCKMARKGKCREGEEFLVNYQRASLKSSPSAWSAHSPDCQTESTLLRPVFWCLHCVPSRAAGPRWATSVPPASAFVPTVPSPGGTPSGNAWAPETHPHLTSPSGCTRWGPQGSGTGQFAGGRRQ